jgi:hypothetical protein
MRTPLPPWLAETDRQLLQAHQRVRMLGSVTPKNAVAERVRLTQVFASGGASLPAWRYEPKDHESLAQSLERLAVRLGALAGAQEAAPDVGLAQAYAARALELATEARIAGAAGTTSLVPLVRQRWAFPNALLRRADALAAEWLSAPPEAAPGSGPLEPTDAGTPSSLASQLRARVVALDLPFEIVLQPDLTPLAAVGDRHILVATGRLVSARDVARTVLHEIEAHARPRARARKNPVGLFLLGTAQGVDDQEGLALLFEERAGFFGAERTRELALRHVAVRAMEQGQDFALVVRELMARGQSPAQAVLLAERTFRGSLGRFPGLGRERLYLPCYLRVRDHLEGHPEHEAVMCAGQIAADGAAALSPYLVDAPV